MQQLQTIVAILSIGLALLAVLVASNGRSGQTGPRLRTTTRRLNNSPAGSDPEVLAKSIADALKLSEFRAGRNLGPTIRVGSLKRYSPNDFHNATMEITQRLRSGNPVSLDLHNMNHSDATRLVDFCSGQIAGRSGWIIQLSDEVLILVPGIE